MGSALKTNQIIESAGISHRSSRLQVLTVCMMRIPTIALLFPSAPKGTKVQVGGTECAIQSANDTTIICQTGPHLPAGKVSVNVSVGDKGQAAGVS